MAFCDKCGAMLAENMKFCDKCGSPVDAPAADIGQSISAYDISADTTAKRSVIDTVKTILPANLFAPEDKTLFFVGIGCMAALSLVYIICMFAFIADICLPIGLGSEAFMSFLSVFGSGANGASPLWILIFLALSLAPAFFAVISFVSAKHRTWSVVAGAVCALITLFSFFVWLISSPDNILEAITYYSGSNKYAWYVLMDALSEVWYLKLLLSAGAVFGLGIDYLKQPNSVEQ